MAKGKKYTDATQALRPGPPPHGRPRPSTWSRAWPRPSSTRPSSWRSASASTPARPTRWCAAPSPCPSGTGKDVRVAVFAAGDAADEARAAGADIVGADDLAAQVEGGHARLRRGHRHARPDAAWSVALGRVLGPRGLMPNPKTGTVTTDVGKAVERVQGRQGRVPHRPLRQRPRARSARSASTRRRPPGQPAGRHRRAPPGQAGLGQGPLHPPHQPVAPPWAPASRSTPTASRSSRTKSPDRAEPGGRRSWHRLPSGADRRRFGAPGRRRRQGARTHGGQ